MDLEVPTQNISSLFISTALIFLAGCQTNPGIPDGSLQSTPTDGPVDYSVIVTVYPVETMTPFIPSDPEKTPSLEPAIDAIVSLVKNDLNQKTGVDLDKIYILEVEAVEWPDSSLGCGQPGTVYLPVITPGFRILLEADGQTYSYHTNTFNSFVLCDRLKPIKINSTP